MKALVRRATRGARRRIHAGAGRLCDRIARFPALARRGPAPRPRVLVYATALQADILALTHALQEQDAVDMLVATPHAEAFLRQPIQAVKPITCPVLEAGRAETAFAARRFRPDLCIVDDLLPPSPLAPLLLYLWHGLGTWKVKPRAELTAVVERIRCHVGDVSRPNPRFIAQCYGDTTRELWVREWGLAPECTRIMGMAYSDWILNPPYDRAWARRSVGLPDGAGPVILLSLSWHYGGRLGAWGELAEIVTFVAAVASERGGHVLLCLHNRFAYSEATLDAILRAARATGNTIVRFKQDQPDNLADLLSADLMVSNFSSFVSYFYVTGKPSIHLDPRPEGGGYPKVASFASGRLSLQDVDETDAWLTPFEDNGGLCVRTRDELARAVVEALDSPDCCLERSRRFLDRHVTDLNGETSSRMTRQVLDWVMSHRTRAPGAVSP